jgi:uncharacterized radical SAM superfamily protein
MDYLKPNTYARLTHPSDRQLIIITPEESKGGHEAVQLNPAYSYSYKYLKDTLLSNTWTSLNFTSEELVSRIRASYADYILMDLVNLNELINKVRICELIENPWIDNKFNLLI